ncbi:uncharacterized protein LOC143250940 [Tachypleus tridentatus]|uniref:uncharacterized protein LOC143250940 n=1 Tax=Tachypleus tridentatus TaxID=6853 RepID=UPI003FD1FA59
MPRSFLVKKNQFLRGFSALRRPEMEQETEQCLLPLHILSPPSQENNVPFDLSLKSRLDRSSTDSSVQDTQENLPPSKIHPRLRCQCKLCLSMVATPRLGETPVVMTTSESSFPMTSIRLNGHRSGWAHHPPYFPFNFPVYPVSQHFIRPPSFSELIHNRTSPIRPDELASPYPMNCERVSPQSFYDGRCSPPSRSLGTQLESSQREILYKWVDDERRGSVSSGSPREGSDSDSGQDVRNKPKKSPDNSRYQCSDCKKNYSTYSGLSKHQQFHCFTSGKKSFSCKHCDKVYVSLGALKMHIRTHTLPCKCTLCGKAFSRPWLLQGHIRTHTGEKPFSCPHCTRAFADRSNLRAHLQTHSDVKKYRCKSCNKTFSRMSLLVKHEEGVCVRTTSVFIDPPSMA